MPITTVDNPKRYAGNGSTTTFATPPYLDVGDLAVYLLDADGNEVNWVYGTHFTLSGAGGTGDGVLTVLTSPTDYTPADGEYLFIWLAIEAIQDSSFPNVTASIASPLMRQLDRQALMIQDLQAQIRQCVRVGPTDLATISGSMLLPRVSVRGGKLLSFATNGTPSVLDPGDLGDITAGDTLPIDAARAVVFKTGATGTTLSFNLAALTASRTITMPDAAVNLGLLASLSALFEAGDVGKGLRVGAAGTGIVAAWDVGQPTPGTTVLGDADGSFTFGTTKALVRTGTDLTADRTFAMSNTGAQEGQRCDFLRDDDGAHTLSITTYGQSDDSTWVMGPRERACFEFDGSHWIFLGWIPTSRNIDMREGIIDRPVFKRYWEASEAITVSSSTAAADFSVSRVKSIALGANTTLTVSNIPPALASANFSGGFLIITQGDDYSITWAADVGTIKWLNDEPPDFTAVPSGGSVLVALGRLYGSTTIFASALSYFPA